MPISEVDPVEAVRLVNESGAILLDVREDDEWSAGHAPGAVHQPLGALDVSGYEPPVPIVAVCRSGKRSAVAAGRLAAAGITVYNLAGGMQAWLGTGQPVIKDDTTPGTVI